MTSNTIAPTATLAGRGHVARASVLIACTEGQLVRFTLAQGGATATGHGAGRCRGGLTAYPMVVVARGSTLAEGASACATTDNCDRRRQLEDTRQVPGRGCQRGLGMSEEPPGTRRKQASLAISTRPEEDSRARLAAGTRPEATSTAPPAGTHRRPLCRASRAPG